MPAHSLHVFLVLFSPDSSGVLWEARASLGRVPQASFPTEIKFPATPRSWINTGETARLRRPPTNYQIPKPEATQPRLPAVIAPGSSVPGLLLPPSWDPEAWAGGVVKAGLTLAAVSQAEPWSSGVALTSHLSSLVMTSRTCGMDPGF